jgi:uncharacterized protein YukE
MAESYAGITVPEGNPGTIRQAAHTFQGVAGGLHGTSDDLRSIPGLVADWQGPASAAFAGTVVTNGSCVSDGAAAMQTCESAARTYADELDDAQKAARQAIEDAKDAQRRIDAANADIEDAQGAMTTAQDQMDAADRQIAASSTTGVPDTGAMADRNAAGTAYGNAQALLGDASRRLQQAQDDLDDAKRRGAKAEKDAKDAAQTATGAFESVAGHTPAAAMFGGSPHAIEQQVLARVRAGDYSVLDEVAFNYLPEDTQKAIAGEIAKESYKTSYNKGSHSMEEMAGIVRRYEHDEQFATGFYNQLGGDGAYDLASNTYYFHGHEKGLQDPSVISLLAPFAALMATATNSKDLRKDFTNKFIGTDIPLKDRLGSQGMLAAFVMAAPAAGYNSKFLSRVGQDILVDPLDDPDVPGIVDISDHQDFMKFMAGNPEAAGLLVAGHHGPDNHFSNAATLLLYGPRYTDDGDALGALITAGTHDLRGTDMVLANQASHAVIQAVPELSKTIPDGAKHSLVTIFDDHVEDVEYLATERANPGLLAHHPSNFMNGLTYDESEKYLKTLLGYDETRTDTSHILGDRVGYDVYQGAGQGDIQYMNRAGALSEMGVIATAEADLDHAKTADALNGFAESATDKALGFALKKVPFAGDIVSHGIHELFSTDHVEKVLTAQAGADLNAYQHIKQLSVSAQVAYGKLPVEALGMLKPDGEIDISFVHGAHGDQDLIPVDANQDGVPDGGNVKWDLNGDGTPETITERDLYNATLGPAEAGADSMSNLRDATWDQAHPPDIDDLKVPSGYDQENPNTFEKVMAWPFDAHGEGTISHDGHVVAHQDDLHWNPDERVYTLNVDDGHGGNVELHYQRGDDDKWDLVKKVGDKWVAVD